MSLEFNDLLRSSGLQTLERILGDEALELCSALSGEDLRPRQLRQLVLSLKTPEEILRSASARSALLAALSPSDATELAQKLGLQNEDPYSFLLQLKFTIGSAQESTLFEFLHVKMVPEKVVEEHDTVEHSAPEYPLFEHQIDVVARAVESFKTQRRLVIHMPTGSGKTRTAMNIICEVLRKADTNVLWLANSEELCEQAAQEFSNAWGFLGNRTLSVTRFYGKHAFPVDMSSGLVVAGLAKLFSSYKSDPSFLADLGSQTDLIVFDEAHQALADTYSEMISGLSSINSEGLVLGLSATPGRTYDDIDEDRRLSNLFGQTKIKLEIPGYDNPMQFLIDEGYLSIPKYFPLKHESSLAAADINFINDSLDVPPSVLRSLGEDPIRNLAILARIKELSKFHARIIVFATSVAHSELLATVLAAQGQDAFSITGNTAPVLRENKLEHFKEDTSDCRILCNYGVLTTGFDAPKTSCVVIARPTKSLVLYSQMVGRGMRGESVGGTKECEVWTVTDLEIQGFRDVTEAIHNWEDVWRSDTT